MRKLIFAFIITLNGNSIAWTTAIRAPDYGALIEDVNHVVFGEITDIKNFNYVIDGQEKTCAYEITVNVQKDRMGRLSELTFLTTQAEIEYKIGGMYLFISSLNDDFEDSLEKHVKFNCNYEKHYIQKQFFEEHSDGCEFGFHTEGGTTYRTVLDRLPFEDEIMIEAKEYCYRMNNFKVLSKAYQNIIIEARQMIFPIDETVGDINGRKWVSINPRWWVLFDIDFKDTINRKASSRNEYSRWKKARVTQEVYEVIDLDQFVKVLFPSNSGNWWIEEKVVEQK